MRYSVIESAASAKSVSSWHRFSEVVRADCSRKVFLVQVDDNTTIYNILRLSFGFTHYRLAFL